MIELNRNMTVKRALIHYHGGKFRLADWIVSFFPSHKLYVEPFGGAGSVLFRKRPCQTEIYNDLDDRLFKVFTTIRNFPKEVAEAISLTLYAKKELHLCYTNNDLPITDVEFTRRFIVASHLAISSTSLNEMTGFRSHVNSSIKSAPTGSGDYCSQAATFSVLPEEIFSVRNRLSNVIIENCDYQSLIDRYDRPGVLWYFDPPYMPVTRGASSNRRGYRHNFTQEQHEILLTKIKSLKGSVLISGYDNELYNNHLSVWKKETKKTICDSRSQRVECLWMNYSLQGNLFN